MNLKSTVKYLMPPILLDGIRWATANGSEAPTPVNVSVRFEIADSWETPPPSRKEVVFQPAKDGWGSFDFATAKRSPDTAMRSPIVRDNLVMLSRTGMKKAISLDFGCADGRYLPLLEAFPPTANWQYVGADTDAGLIQYCRTANPGVRFEHLIAGEPLPFRDVEFDVVLASGVLQAIRDYAKALSELRRVSAAYVLLGRLPVWKHHDSCVLRQRVWDGTTENSSSRNVFNRAVFESDLTQVGFSITERDYGSEVYFISGVAEPVIFNTYLLKRI
jgi:ubiquinone/menaquinone biosynthesis C-methylase UbiE